MRRFHSEKRLACCMNTNKREADHMTGAEGTPAGERRGLWCEGGL